MKVILLENVTSVGNLGDVINVRPGYARNYLFPQGKAEVASDSAVKQFEDRRAELQKRQDEMEASMENAYKALNGYLLHFTARASPDGNLYGSITPQMVATALNAQNLIGDLVIKRGQVAFADGQIKILGEHKATARLSAGKVAEFTVSVLAGSGSSSTSSSAQETTDDTSTHSQPQQDSQ